MNKRILVIDDEEAILNTYGLILSPVEDAVDKLEQKAAALEAELFDDPDDKTEVEPDSYELVFARQGEEGFKLAGKAKADKRPFAVAFIDVRMPPGWDGIQTAAEIRKTDPEIEIVIVTAYSDKDRREIVNKVGMPEKLLYLKKPFDAEEIRQLAMALTRKWDLERKAEKHRLYLEQLLDSVRRIKTLDLGSMSEVLSAILNEVLFFMDGRKGIIARLDNGKNIVVELSSGHLSHSEIDRLIDLVSHSLAGMDSITWVDGIMVFPLKNDSGNLFIMISDIRPPVQDEKKKLIRLLIETCSEVIGSVRKQAQYLRNERIAAIGQIAAEIIHEVSNPLSAIAGAAHLTDREGKRFQDYFEAYNKGMNGPEPDGGMKHWLENLEKDYDPETCCRKMMKYLVMIQNSAERIQGMMNNIRGFASATDSLDFKPRDIGEALEETLNLTRVASKHNLSVHKKWTPPLMALCDINSLKQVFLNLVLNAVQAMGHKGGELWITGKKADNRVAISIMNTGPGIPEETKEKIFEPFFTTKAEGTGLGLSIVKRIIENHNGTIELESAPGQGVTFHITIPAA